MIRKAKENYFIDKIDNNKGNSREMWKTMKTFLPGRQSDLIMRKIEFGNKLLEDDLDIATNFNSYFVNSVAEIVRNIAVLPINTDINIDTSYDIRQKLSSF